MSTISSEDPSGGVLFPLGEQVGPGQNLDCLSSAFLGELDPVGGKAQPSLSKGLTELSGCLRRSLRPR